jgi:hypothetical protein
MFEEREADRERMRERLARPAGYTSDFTPKACLCGALQRHHYAESCH